MKSPIHVVAFKNNKPPQLQSIPDSPRKQNDSIRITPFSSQEYNGDVLGWMVTLIVLIEGNFLSRTIAFLVEVILQTEERPEVITPIRSDFQLNALS